MICPRSEQDSLQIRPTEFTNRTGAPVPAKQEPAAVHGPNPSAGGHREEELADRDLVRGRLLAGASTGARGPNSLQIGLYRVVLKPQTAKSRPRVRIPPPPLNYAGLWTLGEAETCP
jgi:hypothetical protein